MPCSYEPGVYPYRQPNKCTPDLFFVLNIHFNIVFSCTPMSSSDLFSSSSWPKLCVPFISISCLLHANCNYSIIWWRGQIMKLLIMRLSPPLYHFLLLKSKYSPKLPVPCDFALVWETPVRRNVALQICIFQSLKLWRYKRDGRQNFLNRVGAHIRRI
jgi:hypothetical protein